MNFARLCTSCLCIWRLTRWGRFFLIWGVRSVLRPAIVVVGMLELQEIILIVTILHFLMHVSKSTAKRLFAYFFPRLSADVDALTEPKFAGAVEI